MNQPIGPLTDDQIAKFMENIKVFEYLEQDSLKRILKGDVLKTVPKGEKLSLKKTVLVFVTFGSFKASFIDPESKFQNGSQIHYDFSVDYKILLIRFKMKCDNSFASFFVISCPPWGRRRTDPKTWAKADSEIDGF